MELHEYLRLFRRRWWLLAAVASLGVAFAWVTSPSAVAPKVQRFQATHSMIVEPEARQWTPENPETIALLASSGEVPKRVAERLQLPDAEAERLLSRMTIEGDRDLAVIKITATTATAERSRELADAFAEELVTYLNEQEQTAKDRQIESSRKQADDLQNQIAAVSTRIANGDGDPQVLEQQRLVLVSQYGDAETRYQGLIAQAPPDSGLRTLGPALAVEVNAGVHAPRGRTERAVILGTIGLLLAAALAVALERLDVRIKTKEEAEAAFRLPVIAEIPSIPVGRRRRREVLSFLEPASSIAEAYRGLRTTMLILKPSPITATLQTGPSRRRATDLVADAENDPVQLEPQVILVTSTRPSEAKTTTTVNLAAVFAEAGRSVLVIGADIRRPEVHAYLHSPRGPGLTDALAGGFGSFDLESIIVPTMIPGVRLLPPGDHVSNPGELLLQGPDLINAARQLADVVLIDTTPMLNVNDAIQLMSACDSVVLTCRAGRTTTEAARRAQEVLARLRVPVAGVVLVGGRETPGVSTYYYGYQTGFGTGVSSRLRRAIRRRIEPNPVDETLPSAGAPQQSEPELPQPRTQEAELPPTPSRAVDTTTSSGNGARQTTKIASDGPPMELARPTSEQSDPWGWP